MTNAMMTNIHKGFELDDKKQCLTGFRCQASELIDIDTRNTRFSGNL